MMLPRVMPCLLLRNTGLVKTVRFEHPTYVGDPTNAVRIFNEKEVDELVFLDITATIERKPPPLRSLTEIAGECFMPLAYGGGIRTLDEIESILKLGVEKVCINTQAVRDPNLIEKAASIFGSQSIVVSIDVKRTRFCRYEVFVESGRTGTRLSPVEHARHMEQLGAGELFVNAIDRDGTMKGYDLELLQSVTSAVSVPVIACGGAGGVADLVAAVRQGGASAVAAGSLFVFHGKHRAVLISFPARHVLEEAFS
jgi:imidazole glycerol-phosphate synthase subunit HisF